MLTHATNQATAIWAAADALRAEALRLEAEAGDLRKEAKRLNYLAACIADGRPLREAFA